MIKIEKDKENADRPVVKRNNKKYSHEVCRSKVERSPE
jgi:hypothetical protein